MKIHIVGANESLKEIARKYDIQIEDIIKNNLHISSIKNILPGMKLKLPILSEVAQEKFRENTINIQEYYPTIEDFNKFDAESKEVEQEEVKEEPPKTDPNQPQQPVNPNNYPQYPQQPYMQQQPYVQGQQQMQQPYMQSQLYQNQQQPYMQPQQAYPYPAYQQPIPQYYNPYQQQPIFSREQNWIDNKENQPTKPILIDLRKNKQE